MSFNFRADVQQSIKGNNWICRGRVPPTLATVTSNELLLERDILQSNSTYCSSVMIILYKGSGSGELELLDQSFTSDNWARLRQSVSKLLRRRGSGYAADILERYPFEVFSGTNTFGDPFDVLYATVGTDDYLDLADRKDDFDVKNGFKEVADTVYELGTYIRFVAVSMVDDESVPAVSQPTLRTTSNVVQAALSDAEHLIHARGALNGLDRVHTALHGYLRAVANDKTIQMPPDASITQLFKFVIENHPSFDKYFSKKLGHHKNSSVDGHDC